MTEEREEFNGELSSSPWKIQIQLKLGGKNQFESENISIL